MRTGSFSTLAFAEDGRTAALGDGEDVLVYDWATGQRSATLERAGPVMGASDSEVIAWRADASVLEWLEAL